MVGARRAWWVGLLVVVPCASYLACVSDAVMSGSDAGTDVVTGDTVTGDTVVSVSCPSGCLPNAPAGWIGPSAVYDGPSAGKPSACPNPYNQKELEAFQGMDAGPASCNCGSPVFAGAVCQSSISVYGSSSCNSFPSSGGTITNSGCVKPNVSAYVTITQPTVTDAGACAFPDPATIVPPPTFVSQNVSCGMPQATGCPAAQSCVTTPVPSQPFTRLCIHQDGDSPCPIAEYSKRFVAYRNLDDTRGCSPCSGTPTGGMCGNKWDVAGTIVQCNAVATHSVGDCVSIGTLGYVHAEISPTNQTCALDGGAPTGAAKASNPVTFCCNN